jgi:outer membrane protein TolC
MACDAQTGGKLTLNEAIDLSLKNNKQLKLNQTKIIAATNAIKDANAQQLPEASLSGSYLRVNQPNIDMKLKSDDNNGGGNQGSTPDVSQVAYGMATVSVPLFSGFKIQSAKESARYLAVAAKLDADRDREAVIQNTVAAYSNLYKASVAVNLVQENLKQQQQRVTDFTNMEKNGLLARNDLLRAQLQQSNVEVALTEAESNLKIARINMNIMLGLPENTGYDVDTSFLVQAGPDAKSVAEWEQTALQRRKDAASLQAHEKAAYASIKSAKGDYYPSLALTGGYVAAHIPNVLTVTNAVNVGVGLKYNISSLWKTGSKIDEAKNQLHAVQINEEMLTDNIHMQVNEAYENYVVSRKKIEMYQKAIEQADENYRITRNKHTNSLATTTDLLEADVANLQARLNYTSAKADAVVSYNRLLETAGVLGDNK